MNTTSVRKINEDEIKLVRQLALDIWPKAFEKILSTDQIEFMLNMMYREEVLQKDVNRGVEYYILNHENEDCGYAAIERIHSNAYKLHKIYLSQKLHGKGLGKHLIHEMESRAKKNGAKNFRLNVNRNNNAVDFYKSQGYEVILAEDIDIGNGFFMNDYVMEKSL